MFYFTPLDMKIVNIEAQLNAIETRLTWLRYFDTSMGNARRGVYIFIIRC